MRDLGDFQTPPALVAAVLARLGPVGRQWPRVVEPTCGRGRFVSALTRLDAPPREILGVELQPAYVAEARTASADGRSRVELIEGNLFDIDLRSALRWEGAGPLLVVGNPPWVTNAELGALGSDNRPRRQNLDAARGIDAMTGASNFDIAESVWLKLIDELADQSPTIALLCKLSVARNVLKRVARSEAPVARAEVVRIDARGWFGASVEACLLRIDLGPRDGSTATLERIPVYDDLAAAEPSRHMGFAGDELLSDIEAYRRVSFSDGAGPLAWRQGVKHDAAGVMELTRAADGTLRNRAGETVDVEPEHVFPLLKGTHLSRVEPPESTRAVIVTQRVIGHDTRGLALTAPRLWDYLSRHAEAFARRKSSIYRDRPPFAMFGVGPYSFAPYKAAVSGLHAGRRFHAVGPIDGRPAMLDDTGYFLACRSPEPAALAAALCNTAEARALLAALALPGAKRPVTKAVLRRLDLRALLARADRSALLDAAGADVARIAGRPPRWPDRLDDLLEPDGDPDHRVPVEPRDSWPSQRSTISASR